MPDSMGIGRKHVGAVDSGSPPGGIKANGGVSVAVRCTNSQRLVSVVGMFLQQKIERFGRGLIARVERCFITLR